MLRVAATRSPYAEACAAYARAADDHNGDPGLVAALPLNHVRPAPGQALHLDAGVPHAYLRGVGVELMANSDNVLRCGLTPEHVDVDGLLAVASFRTAEATVLTADEDGRFTTPTEEFGLSRLHPATTPVRVDLPTPQILLCTAGRARLRSPGGSVLDLARGASAYLCPGAGPVELTSPDAEVFRATTGTPAQAGSGWPNSRS